MITLLSQGELTKTHSNQVNLVLVVAKIGYTIKSLSTAE
jgi:hypothetical protein